jgi:hypothetical protein
MSSARFSCVVAIWVLFAPACFHPNYDHPTCGPNGECPRGLSCSSLGLCEDPADPPACLGTDIVKVCLLSAPTTPITISSPTQIDTTNSPICAVSTSGDNYCVLAGTTITIDETLRASGTRPLVLLATDTITANAMIDVGSHRGATPEFGAGADPATCDAGTAPTTGTYTSGGGAGGSFLGLGGAGGAGGLGGAGGMPGAAASTVTELRGGCPGQDGDSVSSDKSIGGHGGGAVFLIAGNQILVSGGINAAGEGGGGGVNCNVPSSGGGGGGAGGMIGFDAPTVVGSGLILANGGGGGGGCDHSVAGKAGADPTAVTAAIGGSGGGVGGNGSAGTSAGPGAAGGKGSCNMCSAGGGGGGAGLIKAPVTADLGTQVSPIPTP